MKYLVTSYDGALNKFEVDAPGGDCTASEGKTTRIRIGDDLEVQIILEQQDGTANHVKMNLGQLAELFLSLKCIQDFEPDYFGETTIFKEM